MNTFRSAKGPPSSTSLCACVSASHRLQISQLLMTTKFSVLCSVTVLLYQCGFSRLSKFVPFFCFEQPSTKTSCQCFRESCLCGEDFYIYVAFWRARETTAPKNLNSCKFQLRVKLKVQR